MYILYVYNINYEIYYLYYITNIENSHISIENSHIFNIYWFWLKIFIINQYNKSISYFS